MKPNTSIAMADLIVEIREALPFNASESQICSGVCKGCSLKLLDYLDIELVDWEYRLENGETPNFGDLKRISTTARKIYKVLDRNGLIP